MSREILFCLFSNHFLMPYLLMNWAMARKALLLIFSSTSIANWYTSNVCAGRKCSSCANLINWTEGSKMRIKPLRIRMWLEGSTVHEHWSTNCRTPIPSIMFLIPHQYPRFQIRSERVDNSELEPERRQIHQDANKVVKYTRSLPLVREVWQFENLKCQKPVKPQKIMNHW